MWRGRPDLACDRGAQPLSGVGHVDLRELELLGLGRHRHSALRRSTTSPKSIPPLPRTTSRTQPPRVRPSPAVPLPPSALGPAAPAASRTAHPRSRRRPRRSALPQACPNRRESPSPRASRNHVCALRARTSFLRLREPRAQPAQVGIHTRCFHRSRGRRVADPSRQVTETIDIEGAVGQQHQRDADREPDHERDPSSHRNRDSTLPTGLGRRTRPTRTET